MPNRDLHVSIDGDARDFDRALDEAAKAARKLDRQLGKTERAQKAQERQSIANAAAVKAFGREENKAGEQARQMGRDAKKAGDVAERAQLKAAAAARAAAQGLGSEERAARLAAEADDKVARAAFKAAAAHRAQARAADEAADQERQLARDAQIAAAAQRLGQLRAAGAVKEHDSMLRHLQSVFPEISKSADRSFSFMSKSGGRSARSLVASMRSASAVIRGPAVLGAIGVALQFLPAAALLAAGGITAALGGAFAAVGIIAAAKSKEVQAAFSTLATNVKGELSVMAKPFETTLIHAAHRALDAFQQLAPTIAGVFAKMAPAIDRFTAYFARALVGLRPVFSSLGDAFDAILGSLGPRMGEIVGNLSTAFTSVFRQVEANSDAFAGMVVDLSKVVSYAGQFLGWLIKIGPAVKWIWTNISSWLNPISAAYKLLSGLGGLMQKLGFGNVFDKIRARIQRYAGELDKADAGTNRFTMSMHGAAGGGNALATAQMFASKTAKELKTALDRLTGANQGVYQTETAYKAALDRATAAAKANGATLNANTKKGRANRTALLGVAQAAQRHITAMKKDDASTAALNKEMGRARKKFIQVAMSMGASRKKAVRLADDLLGVKGSATQARNSTDAFHSSLNRLPGHKHVGVHQHGADPSRHSVDRLNASLDRLHDHDIYITTHYQATGSGTVHGSAHGGYVGGYADGGPVRGYPTGGPVYGPGTTTSDSIPTRLSRGEYVVNAADTANNRALLDMINYGHVTVPVSAGSRGGDGASMVAGGTTIHQTFQTQPMDVFQLARESAREAAWTLR